MTGARSGRKDIYSLRKPVKPSMAKRDFFRFPPQLIDSVKPTALYMHVGYHGCVGRGGWSVASRAGGHPGGSTTRWFVSDWLAPGPPRSRQPAIPLEARGIYATAIPLALRAGDCDPASRPAV